MKDLDKESIQKKVYMCKDFKNKINDLIVYGIYPKNCCEQDI